MVDARSPEVPRRTLAPGDPPLELTVDPRPHHVPTGLLVAPGERYRFTAMGQWRDFTQPSGPEGWHDGVLTRWARLPGVPLFMLCGSVGKDDARAFPIGPALDWTVPAGTRDDALYLFANDWRLMYWNNHAASEAEGGPLRVTITRLG